jgi:MFS family permease
MPSPRSISPLAVFFLVLPFGMGSGFVQITLPFVLARSGMAPGEIAQVTALGLSASVWSFLWGPMVDLTLTLRRWYAIGLTAAVVLLLVLSAIPPRAGVLLAAFVFLSQVAVTWIRLPIGGLMAHTVDESRKGRAAGWHQAGNLGGAGLGGGAGVWLASYASYPIAATAISALMAACAAALLFVPNLRPATDQALGQRLRETGRDFRRLLTTPQSLLIIALVTSPIGAGALSNIWSSVASDWRASDNDVALYTGLLASAVSTVGCVLGGWLADRAGRWSTFFGAGAFMAAVAAVLAAAPRTPAAYGAGVLVYGLSIGLAFAAYSALVLLAVGRGAASTKFAIMSSLGNIPVVYMTMFDGWAHDEFGATGMLLAEAAMSAAAIVLGMIAVWALMPAAAAVEPADEGRHLN